MQRRNDPKYGKYMVGSDIVIGVAINGEARAYPMHVIYVHQIINDTLGGVPIAITYEWLSDSVVVFDRRPPGSGEPASGARTADTAVAHRSEDGRPLEFHHAGLVYNSNLVMYDPNEKRTSASDPVYGAGGESLWSQLLGAAISGPAAARQARLTIVPCELATWADWS